MLGEWLLFIVLQPADFGREIVQAHFRISAPEMPSETRYSLASQASKKLSATCVP